MLRYINSLGLDAQKIGNVVMGRLPSAMSFCVGGIACSVDRMEQTQGGSQARIDCAAACPADPTSPSISQWHSYLSLANPQCKPVTFQPSERPFVLQICIYFITIPERPETILRHLHAARRNISILASVSLRNHQTWTRNSTFWNTIMLAMMITTTRNSRVA
jgi:hypothetical protein